jgi:hypothetical protein
MIQAFIVLGKMRVAIDKIVAWEETDHGDTQVWVLGKETPWPIDGRHSAALERVFEERARMHAHALKVQEGIAEGVSQLENHVGHMWRACPW